MIDVNVLLIDFSRFIRSKTDSLPKGKDISLGQELSTLDWYKHITSRGEKDFLRDIEVDRQGLDEVRQFLSEQNYVYLINNAKDIVKIIIDNYRFEDEVRTLDILSSERYSRCITMDEHLNISINNGSWLGYVESYLCMEPRFIDSVRGLDNKYDIVVFLKAETRTPPMFDGLYSSIKQVLKRYDERYCFGTYSREDYYRTIPEISSIS